MMSRHTFDRRAKVGVVYQIAQSNHDRRRELCQLMQVAVTRCWGFGAPSCEPGETAKIESGNDQVHVRGGVCDGLTFAAFDRLDVWYWETN